MFVIIVDMILFLCKTWKDNNMIQDFALLWLIGWLPVYSCIKPTIPYEFAIGFMLSC